MSAIKLADVKDIINELIKDSSISSTRWITLKKDSRGREWALVLAWCDDFDDEGQSDFIRGTYRICGKIAYNNSYMKEYDMDWLMPYDEETGEVNDTETSIGGYDQIPSAVTYWESLWDEIQKTLD